MVGNHHGLGGLPSPRTHESFPAGLRVLVVDDDLTWLKILEKMLKKCSYEVTTCCLARDALNLLRERKTKFDIVISDVNMPDMDGFKLLERVGLEMDLPVIMMSVDGETSRVMKGVQHGACDYLLKPVRMKELRNIWQHVLRKKIHEVKDIENQDHGSSQSSQMIKNGFDGFDGFDDELMLNGNDSNGLRKRKDMGTEEYTEQDLNNPGVVKKARIAWTVDLHQKFVDAVNQIGFDKVGPKKILDSMNVPWLTRENVASHLQKYRLYLSRIQKKNESKDPICGIEQSEFSSKDTQGRFGIQSSTTPQENISPGSFGYSGSRSFIEDLREISEDNLSMVSFAPSVEAKGTFDVPLAKKMSDGQQIAGVLSLVGMVTGSNDISPGKQFWNEEVTAKQLLQYPKQEQHYLPLEEGYPALPLPTQQQYFQIDCIQKSPTSTNSGNDITERDGADPFGVKTLHRDFKSHRIRNLSPVTVAIDPISAPGGHETVKHQGFEQLPAVSSLSSTKFQDLDQNCIDTWSSDTTLALNNSPFWAASPEDLRVCLFKGYGCFEDVEFNNLAFFDCVDSTTSVAELLGYTYDESGSSCDYQGESTDHPILGEGLFE